MPFATPYESPLPIKLRFPRPIPLLPETEKRYLCRLVYAGTMPNGRFDVGYMIEHLVSRPIHVAIMHDMNADPQIGPQRNADFHVILTAVIDDLKKAYVS